MTTQPPIRVLIADDHRLFAETLGLTLAADLRSPLPEESLRAREAAAEVVDALLELAAPPAGSATFSPALPPRLLQFRARLAH
jgi:hypothetical protein